MNFVPLLMKSMAKRSDVITDIYESRDTNAAGETDQTGDILMPDDVTAYNDAVAAFDGIDPATRSNPKAKT